MRMQLRAGDVYLLFTHGAGPTEVASSLTPPCRQVVGWVGRLSLLFMFADECQRED